MSVTVAPLSSEIERSAHSLRMFRDNLYERLGRTEIPSLNGLRAIAIFTVILFHADIAAPGLNSGHGVMLFFVLSGFLITWILLRERDKTGTVSLRNFYIRRSLRIFPAFYGYWALVMVGLSVRHTPIAWGHAISALFYVNNYYYALSTHVVGWLQHAWSLAVEEQFYLLWPLAFVFLARRRKLVPALLVAIPAFWLCRAILYLEGAPERYIVRAFEARGDMLLVGCLLAVLLKREYGLRFWQRCCTWPALVATIAALQISLLYTETDWYRFCVASAIEPPLMAMLIIQLVVMGERLLGWGPIRYIGRVSYGMYLYHEIGHAVGERLSTQPFIVLLIGIGVTTVMATLSFFLLEQPLLQLKDKTLQIMGARRPALCPSRIS